MATHKPMDLVLLGDIMLGRFIDDALELDPNLDLWGDFEEIISSKKDALVVGNLECASECIHMHPCLHAAHAWHLHDAWISHSTDAQLCQCGTMDVHSYYAVTSDGSQEEAKAYTFKVKPKNAACLKWVRHVRSPANPVQLWNCSMRLFNTIPSKCAAQVHTYDDVCAWCSTHFA